MTMQLSFDETFPAPPTTVWRALTDPDALAGWLMAATGFEACVGVRFRLSGPPGEGFRGWIDAEVLAIDPPNRMVWSWSDRDDTPATIVTFELTAAGEATRLRLTHVGDAPPESEQQFRAGWTQKVGALALFLGPVPEP